MQLDAREDVCIFRGVRRIPVYLMDDDRLGTRENSFIPDGCPCVFVNARSIDAILDGFGIGPRTQLSAYSEYERASVYATVLIHEVGHLNNGDARSYAEPLVLTSAEIVKRLNTSMSSEVCADRLPSSNYETRSWKTAGGPFLAWAPAGRA